MATSVTSGGSSRPSESCSWPPEARWPPDVSTSLDDGAVGARCGRGGIGAGGGSTGLAGLGGGACCTGAERAGRSAALTGCTLVNVAVRRRVGALRGALTGACTTVGATTGRGAAGCGCSFAGAGAVVGVRAGIPSTDDVGFGVGMWAGVHAPGAAAAEAVPVVVLATAGNGAGTVPPVAGAQGVPAAPAGAGVVPGAGLVPGFGVVPAVVVVPIAVVAGTTTAAAVVPQEPTTTGAGATTGVGDVGAAGPSMAPVGVVGGTETLSSS